MLSPGPLHHVYPPHLGYTPVELTPPTADSPFACHLPPELYTEGSRGVCVFVVHGGAGGERGAGLGGGAQTANGQPAAATGAQDQAPAGEGIDSLGSSFCFLLAFFLVARSIGVVAVLASVRLVCVKLSSTMRVFWVVFCRN